MSKRTIWTDELVTKAILDSVEILQIERMPTAQELKIIGRNDLHCRISKTLKYSGWAQKLNIPLKSCETRFGNEYEAIIKDRLTKDGFSVEQMTTKHPYDLLVNGVLKVDVKVTKPHRHFEARAHTFHLSKKYATCDLYICIALDESGSIERHFIIPAVNAILVTINVGKESKYNRFIDRWDYVDKFVSAFGSVTDEEAV